MRKYLCFPVLVLLLIQRFVLRLFNSLSAFLTVLFAKMGQSTDASIGSLCDFVLKGEESRD